MVDDAELDRAKAHRPAAILALGQADRFAGQRLVEIDLGVVPADRAVGADPPHRMLARVFGLAQHAIPAPRRERVMFGRRGVAERGMRPLLVVDAPEIAQPVELLAQAARRRRGGIAQQGQVQPFKPAVLLRFAGAMRSGRTPALMTVTANRDSPPAPVDANGGPLSERSRKGRPNSRKAASRTGHTCSVSPRPSA